MKDFPKPLSKQCITKILDQMNNLFYKINKKAEKFDIGIFCYIKYSNKKIPILIINNYLDNNDNNNISVTRNDGTTITIELEDSIYKDKEYNISIVEIKENMNYKIQFCDIDDEIYSKESEILYKNESIYIIQYKNENDIFISNGVIKYVNNKEIINFCNIIKNYKFFPIFKLSNNKLVGFQFSNKGIFIKYIINKFTYNKKYRYKYENKNEINIIVKVEKDDINKNIYFLDSYKARDIKNEHLKELSKYNTKLYINNKEYEYKKFFNPDKEGEYKIRLEFKNKLKDCSFMFAGCNNIIGIDFTSFISDEVTNMEYMFFYCKNLKNLNSLSFNTKKVSNMRYMLVGINQNQTFDLSSIDFRNNNDKKGIFSFEEDDIWLLNNNKINKEIIKGKIEEKDEKQYYLSFIGEFGVGTKTSLINRIIDNVFLTDPEFSLSTTFKLKKVMLKNGKIIQLILFDIDGRESRRAISKFFVKDSDCIILGFDITLESTLLEIKNCWYFFVKEYSSAKLIYLIGNKIDKYLDRKVSEEEARSFAKEKNLRYFEISCKTGEGIPAFFNDLISEIVKIK